MARSISSQGLLSRRRLLGASAAFGAAAVLPGAFRPLTVRAEDVTLTLVAYSTPREAYEQLIPLFAATEAGTGVTFEQSYGASGDQSRAVESGLPADVVAFSLEPDITRLVKAGLVDETWNTDEYKGMVTDSVVAFGVRAGNPKTIAGWSDLVREEVQVLTPNPLTSGGARWNIMAAWGALLKQGKTEDEAKEYLKQLFQHVPVQDKSARESLQTFIGGVGDVLIGYENELELARENGEELEIVIPAETILIENPIAIVNTSANKEKAQAFIDYLRTPDAQKVFGENHYRPVVKEVLDTFTFVNPATLFTIADLGGWADASTKFFDPDNGIVAEVQA
ncbi:MAG: sulfate ABC transporter substrate-binding protein [Thermomicrobiales bacterium]